MYNVFQSWSFMERTKLRSVCFKGGGGSTEIPETEAQRASAEIAMKNYNDYMATIRPVEVDYIKDVTGDPKNRESLVAGQISADAAQKVGTPAIDPNKGLTPGLVANVANPMADAQVKGKQAVDAQRMAGFQSVVDMGMGKNTSAQLGLSSLASQSVSEAYNDQKNRQAEYDANMSAAGTAGGMALGMTKNLYDDSQKK